MTLLLKNKTMKRSVVIFSHCNTEQKISVLRNNILKLKSYSNLDIILTSHISLPQDIIDSVEYFIYDKSNPILNWPQRGMFFYKIFPMGNSKVYLNYIQPDYGWTVFNQLLLGGNLSYLKQYDITYFMNYDLSLDSNLDSIFSSQDQQSYFFSVKNWHDSTIFPGLILFKVNKSQLFHILSNTTLENYCKDGIPEHFLSDIIQDFDYIHPEYNITDQIDYYDKNNYYTNNSNPFTDSIYPEFDYFMSNYDFTKWYCNDKGKMYLNSTFFFNIKEEITIKVDNIEQVLKPGVHYIFNSTNIRYKEANLINKFDNKQQYISVIE